MIVPRQENTRSTEIRLRAKINHLALDLLQSESQLVGTPITQEEAVKVLDALLNKTYRLVHVVKHGMVDNKAVRPKTLQTQPPIAVPMRKIS